jgi:hypothetical protein
MVATPRRREEGTQANVRQEANRRCNERGKPQTTNAKTKARPDLEAPALCAAIIF